MIKHETKIVFKSYIGGVRKINVGREFQGNFWWIDVFLLILKTKEMYTFIYIITQLIFLLYHLLSTAWFGILPGWFYYHRKYHMNGKYDLLVLYQHFSSSENKDCFFLNFKFFVQEGPSMMFETSSLASLEWHFSDLLIDFLPAR